MNDKFYQELEQSIQKMNYGLASFTIKVHAGQVSTVLGQNFKQRQFKKGETTQAVAHVLTQIKKLCDGKKTGTLSMTLCFKDGELIKTEIQENLTRKYDIFPNNFKETLDKPLK